MRMIGTCRDGTYGPPDEPFRWQHYRCVPDDENERAKYPKDRHYFTPLGSGQALDPVLSFRH